MVNNGIRIHMQLGVKIFSTCDVNKQKKKHSIFFRKQKKKTKSDVGSKIKKKLRI